MLKTKRLERRKENKCRGRQGVVYFFEFRRITSKTYLTFDSIGVTILISNERRLNEWQLAEK